MTTTMIIPLNYAKKVTEKHSDHEMVYLTEVYAMIRIREQRLHL
jgi:hypothetical protein